MRAYRLTIHFYSPLVLYDPITLDAILAYALAVRRNGRKAMFCIPQQVQGRDEEIRHELHGLITHHTPFYPVAMASYLQPLGSTAEYLDSWKKRFESKYSRLADFGRGRRRVNTGSGKYRSYNMPLPAIVMQSGYFAYLGKSEVADLLAEYVVAIGKKRSEGFGWIEKLELNEADYSCYDIARMRPVPRAIAEKNKIKGRLKFCAWQSPYWLRQNMCECVVPE